MTQLTSYFEGSKQFLYSLLHCIIYFGLFAFFLPVLLVSLLFYVILLLPLCIVSFIYLNSPDSLEIFTFPTVLRMTAEDIGMLFGLNALPKNLQDFSSIRNDFRTISIDPQRNPFTTSLEDERNSTRLATVTSRSKPRINGSFGGLRASNPRGTSNKPFDLTGVPFSPHWSADNLTNWSPAPSPLELSRSASPIYPSSNTSSSRRIGSPASTLNNEKYSKSNSEDLARIDKDDIIHDSDRNVTPNLDIDNPVVFFSESLPEELRNVKNRNMLYNPGQNSPASSSTSEAEEAVTRFDPNGISETNKQVLLSTFRSLIEELEGIKMHHRLHDIDINGTPSAAPTPPPFRPSAIPRIRESGENSKPRPLSDIPNGPRSGTGKGPGDSTDGLYGADTVDQSFWQGFDQNYDGERSFDSLVSDEDIQVEQWKCSVGKWAEKGVRVMKPVDEESMESESIKLSPASKKEVRWKDEAGPTSPVAEVIPRPETPIRNITSDIENTDSRHARSQNNTIDNNSFSLSDKETTEIEQSRTLLETPTRHGQVLSKLSNQEALTGFPILSPTGSVSGKLIQLFEELSRSETHSPLISVNSSPIHSFASDAVVGDLGGLLNNAIIPSDGSMDGITQETVRDWEGRSSTPLNDGMEECF
ncbi:hypothetical protein EDC01DRAFT_224025 [Geopyxis carbonaria]|nr:hypothetical protein EDC01DRAFT_224025 [Geopyxis carbonaria]